MLLTLRLRRRRNRTGGHGPRGSFLAVPGADRRSDHVDARRLAHRQTVLQIFRSAAGGGTDDCTTLGDEAVDPTVHSVQRPDLERQTCRRAFEAADGGGGCERGRDAVDAGAGQDGFHRSRLLTLDVGEAGIGVSHDHLVLTEQPVAVVGVLVDDQHCHRLVAQSVKGTGR